MPEVRSGLARQGERMLVSAPVTSVVRSVTGHLLRIVAYHHVPDRAAFRAQLEVLARHHRFVTADDVLAAHAGRRLPRSALWLTFDDGHPDVMDCLDDLARHHASACLFACPGLLDTDEPFWWQVLELAAARGAMGDDEAEALRLRLKEVPDPERREQIATLKDQVEADTGTPLRVTQLSSAQLATWAAAGHEVGNHSWDHALLDRCTTAQQRHQVQAAHDRLVAGGYQPRFFAFPNGNRAEAAERLIRELGYAPPLMFDHRLADPGPGARFLSRLRLDTDAPGQRARAITSGTHPLAFRFSRW